MRRNPQAIGLGSGAARHLAGGVLGLAVLVALFGIDSDAAVDAGRGGKAVTRAEVAALSRLAPGEPRLAEPPAAAWSDQVADGPATSASPGRDQAGAAMVPADGASAAAASPFKPDPDAMERLIAAARARSGGVDQGDELVR